MTHTLRPIEPTEVQQFRESLNNGFGKDSKPAGDERFLSLMPLERTVAAFDGDEIVGTLGDFPLVLTVPGGGQLSMAGTTMVTVQPTHTRQGILRAMVRRHLDNAVERGDAVAGLWASEPGIYERFGFGQAADLHDIKIDARRVALPGAGDEIEIAKIKPEQIPEVVVPFWSSIATTRSGFVERNEARWQDIMNDEEHMRGGASAARHIVARRSGQVVGYLEYRQNGKWNDMVADGELSIGTLFAADDAARHALWAFALDVDLFPNVNFWNGAPDDPLAYQVDNAREVRRTVLDGLYVRILDVKAALEARSYEQDGAITIEVADDMGYGSGRFTVVVSDGTAVVSSGSMQADISLSIRDLGALYLGRDCVEPYHSMGRIVGEDACRKSLGQLFRTARAPWCPEMF